MWVSPDIPLKPGERTPTIAPRTPNGDFMRMLLPVVLCFAPVHAQEAAAPAPPPAVAAPAVPGPVAGSFKITFDSSLQAEPYSGRVYIALNKDAAKEPRLHAGNWFAKNPVLSLDVTNIPPGGSVTIDGTALAYPKPLAEWEPGDYAAQAIARRSQDGYSPGQGAGDLYSDPITVSLKPGDAGIVEFKLTKAAEEQPFGETDRVKEVSFVSPLLSQFYGREVKARAAVILPKNWKADPAAHYPTVYFIGGFGSTHHFALSLVKRLPASADEVMVVVPDASGPLGHTAFADSANNGPRGRSLIEEIIPAVETRFHGAVSRNIRWITGISSGGWASLWLAVTYPDTFGNCWSFCPDPVDFRDFQKVNLYAEDANLYKDASGSRRPLAHNGKEVLIHYDDFCHQERVLGRGGQIHAFEAVFSEKGPDGKPRPLFNRDTGAVDPVTAKSWEKYDIRLVIERNWATIGPKINGNVHVYAGELDNFYLEGSARLLAKAMKDLGTEIDVHIIPKMGHDIPPVPWKVMFQILRDRAAGNSNLPGLSAPNPAAPPSK
jgi:pimeloyl-ACP methyl ester carboxylesterase